MLVRIKWLVNYPAYPEISCGRATNSWIFVGFSKIAFAMIYKPVRETAYVLLYSCTARRTVSYLNKLTSAFLTHLHVVDVTPFAE